MRKLLLCLTLFLAGTPLGLQTTTTPVLGDSAVKTSTRLPTLTSITSALSSAWSWVSGIWRNVAHKMGFHRVPGLISKLYASRSERENQFAATYLAKDIPADIARIAGVLDRMEEDFRLCKQALETEQDEYIEESLRQEIQRIDNEVDAYMDTVQPVIDKHEKKAFTKKKTDLFQFIQVLQSRSFLTQLLD